MKEEKVAIISNKREKVKLTNMNKQFRLNITSELLFSKDMYHKIQVDRLKRLRPFCLKSAYLNNIDLNNVIEVKDLTELMKHQNGKKVLCTGSIYRKIEFRPSPLQQYTKFGMKRQFLNQPKFENYASDNDQITLEDDQTRININYINPEIIHWFNRYIICTGIVVAILGETIQNRDRGEWNLNVSQVFLPKFPIQITKPVSNTKKPNNLLFISNLNIIDTINSQEGHLIQLENFISWISGLYDDKELVTSISALVIVGNTLNNFEKYITDIDKDSAFKEKQNLLMAAVERCSQLLNGLAAFLEVLVLPSVEDFCDSWYPVQPLMPFSLGIGSTRDTRVKMCTNPSLIKVAGDQDVPNETTLLITDGIEIRDQLKYILTDYNIMKAKRKDCRRQNLTNDLISPQASQNNNQQEQAELIREIEEDIVLSQSMDISGVNQGQEMLDVESERIQLMRMIATRNLLSRHQCPTQPDTIYGYTLDEDKLIMESMPNLQVTKFDQQGGMYDLYEPLMEACKAEDVDCKILAVPDFYITKTGILYDFMGKESRVIDFGLDTKQGMI